METIDSYPLSYVIADIQNQIPVSGPTAVQSDYSLILGIILAVVLIGIIVIVSTGKDKDK